MFKRILLLSVLLLTATLIGCADKDEQDDLVGTYSSVSSQGESKLASDAPGVFSIKFDQDSQGAPEIRPSAGCNSIWGGYSIDSGKLVVENLASTKMACNFKKPGEEYSSLEREKALIDFLEGSPKIKTDGDKITLEDSEGNSIKFEQEKSS